MVAWRGTNNGTDFPGWKNGLFHETWDFICTLKIIYFEKRSKLKIRMELR